MKSNKKYTLFNYAMFLNAVKQLRVICLVSFGILTLFTVLIPVGRAVNMSNYGSEYALPVVVSVKSSFIYMYLIYMVLTPFITLHLFSFLTKRNTSDYYHSFPQKRGCVFTTYFLVIAAWLFVMTFGSGVLSVIVYTCLSKYLTFSFITLLQFVISIYIAALLVEASILIACQITGTLFTNFVVSGLIIFLPRTLLTIVAGIVSSGNIIFVADKLLPVLDNKYNIVFNSVFSIISTEISPMTSIPSIVYTLLLTAGYFFAARVLFIRRKSESAGSASVNGALQCVIRIALALPICLIPISKIFSYISGNESVNSNDVFWICVSYLIAIIIMLIYELISTRKFSSVIKALPSIGILAGINIIVLVSVAGIYHAEINYTPEVKDIEYVKISNQNSNYTADYFQQKMNSYKITDSEIIRYVSDGLIQTIERKENFVNDNYVTTTVAIKSGLLTKYRRIVLEKKDYAKFSEILMQCEDIKNIYTRLPAYNKNTVSLDGDFTADEKKELYNSIRQEVKHIDYKTWYNNLYNNCPQIALSMNTSVDDQSVIANLPLTSDTPKTLLMYMNHTNSNYDNSKLDGYIDYIKNYKDSDGYYNFYVTAYTSDFVSSKSSYCYEASSKGDMDKLNNIVENIKSNYSDNIESLSKNDKELVMVNIYCDSPTSENKDKYTTTNFFTYIDSDIAETFQ